MVQVIHPKFRKTNPLRFSNSPERHHPAAIDECCRTSKSSTFTKTLSIPRLWSCCHNRSGRGTKKKYEIKHTMSICHVFFVRFLGFTSFCCSIWSENTSRSITNRKRQRKSCEGFFPKVCGLLVVLRCSTFVLWRSWLWIYHVCTHVFGSFHGSIRIAGCWAQHPTWVPKLGPNSMLIGRSLRQGFKQDKRWAERGSMMTINKMVVSFCQFYGGFFLARQEVTVL